MRCRKWAVEISKLHERELSDEGEAALRRHIESCRHCRSSEAELRSVSALLNESHELPVPELLSQRITASVSERMRLHSGGGLFDLIGFVLFRHRVPVTAAVLIIGLCIGGLAGRQIAGPAEVGAAKPSYDLLALGEIEPSSQAVAFSHIWQDDREGGRP